MTYKIKVSPSSEKMIKNDGFPRYDDDEECWDLTFIKCEVFFGILTINH
jgi:hypothetical protein